jgi:hypothetical protein
VDKIRLNTRTLNENIGYLRTEAEYLLHCISLLQGVGETYSAKQIELRGRHSEASGELLAMAASANDHACRVVEIGTSIRQYTERDNAKWRIINDSNYWKQKRLGKCTRCKLDAVRPGATYCEKHYEWHRRDVAARSKGKKT